MFAVLLILCVPRALAQLGTPYTTVLQQIIDSVVSEDGDNTKLNVFMRATPLSLACGFAAWPGIVCASSSGPIKQLDTALLFDVPTAMWRPSAVSWVGLLNCDILSLNTQGGMRGTIPTLYPAGLKNLLIGDPLTSTANNQITGTIPSGVFTNTLQTLQLYSLPQVVGPLPASVTTTTALKSLSINYLSALDGPVPAFTFDNTQQQILIILNTALQGPIPVGFCANTMLKTVIFIGNPDIVDPLPPCFFTCTGWISSTICSFQDNDFCAIGGTLTVLPQQDNCLDPGDAHPCSLTRDNTDCITCDGTENGSAVYDECDVCLEPLDLQFSQSCADCSGEPNGNNSYDACDICYEPDDPRRNTECSDCAGVPNGPAVYDSCDVCNGNDSELDCLGVCFGSSQYDHCDVCGGTDDCIDCFGVIGGSAVVDDCGECNGHDACFPCDDVDKNVCGLCFSSQLDCLDCAGVPFGTSAYDSCDVCNGSDDCVDCSGAQHGTEAYDICDICGGDGTSCLDCSGTPFGTLAADACNVCGGSNACHDCAGVELGFAVYDRCDVCEGDGSSCLDCAGVANGAAAYDACDICNGTGPPCLPVAEQERFREEAETKLTNVIIAILLILLSLCVVCVIFYLLLFNRREKRRAKRAAAKRAAPAEEEPGPPVIPMPESGTPVPIKTVALLAVALALISPASASQAGSVQFLRLMKQYTNAGTVYPEWYINEGNEFMTGACVPGTPGLECDNWVIVGLDIARPLAGNVSEPIFNNLQHVRHVFIAAGPQLSFSLANLECALHLESLIVIQSRIYGTLPERIGELQKLHVLELVSTKDLRGDLPLSMNRLNCLKKLIISDAALTCTLPTVLINNWQMLEVLDLRGNRCSGELGTGMMTSSFMKILRLDNNCFSSVHYNAVIFVMLHVLGLSSNKLTVLPNVFFVSGTLKEYYIDDNPFGGWLPSITYMTALEKLGISHCKFNASYQGIPYLFDMGNKLSGPPLSLLRANNNSFRSLSPAYDETDICGECDLRDNWLCHNDPANVPPIYFVLQCKLDLMYNMCGICGDMSCLDCANEAHGSHVYDACDVCSGDGSTCADCNGVPNGSSLYDACDICDGDNSTCIDCAGVPGGAAAYDRCDVCAGDDSTCADCAGVANGPSEYDICEVCDGDGSSCMDCNGVIGGTSRFDECGVCDGRGASCSDPLQMDVAERLRRDEGVSGFVVILIIVGLLVLAAGAACCFVYWRWGRNDDTGQ